MAKGYTSEIYERSRAQALEYYGRGGNRSKASPSAKDEARAAIEELKSDPERRLIDSKHPQHQEAVEAFKEWHEVLYDTPLIVEKSKSDEKPFMPLLVRQIAEENPHHRRESAKQAVVEILNPRRWEGADGKGKHPAVDPASPEHEGWVEGLKVLLEWANTEPEGK